MKTLCVTILFLGIFQSAVAVDDKETTVIHQKFSVPLPPSQYQYHASDSNVSLIGFEPNEELAGYRKCFEVAALEKPESGCSLSFQIFVIPQLGGGSYCVCGKLFLRKNDASGSTILLRRIEKEKVEEQHWDLTNTQADAVLNWFSKAEFLDVKTPPVVPPSVLDGVMLAIEGYVDGRNFKILRNAYDSPKTEEFYRCVDAFRIWKAPPDQKLTEPTAATVVTPAAQK
jgi:hypothetical protein